MAKGKKKGGKSKEEEQKEELPEAMSSLSVSEEPSTSAEAPEEEGLGMGMSSAAARRKAKKAAKAAPIGTLPTTSSAEPAPVVAPPEPEKAPEPKVEEDDGLGLGLGGGGKKRPRKKKAAPTEAAPAPVGVPTAVVASMPDPGPAQPSVPAAAPTPWGGAGRGRASPAPASQPPAGYQQQGPPRGYPQQQGPPMGYPQQAVPPMGYPQQPGPPGYPQQGHPQPGHPQQGYPQPGYPQSPAPVASPPQQAVAPSQPMSPQAGQGDMSPASSPTSRALCRYKIPRRIDGNTVRCEPVRVLTNYLEMNIKPLKIHRYDVTFKPDKPKKYIPKVFIEVKKKHFPKELIAFDQMKNCYSKTPLPKVPLTDRFTTEVEYTDQNGKKMNFEVSLKFTGIVDLGTIIQYMKTGGTSLSPPTEAIQCVDVILRQGTLESYIKAGRQFFRRPYSPIDLTDGLEMWTGLFQSAIFTTRPFINVDVAHKGFPKQQSLVQAYTNDFRLNPNQPIEQQRGYGAESFQAFVKGLKVVAYIGGDTSTTGQKREFIVNGLSDPPTRQVFNMDIGNGRTKSVSVAEYFAKEKGVRLKYPNLNCVWVGPRDKNINYPMELLDVAYGHARNRQLNEKQLSIMVKQAATPPDERKRKIEEVIKDMNYSGNRDFKQFGLEISDKFFAVQAKVLPAPRLETGSGPVHPRNGAWQASKLLKAETLQRWGFIVIEPDMRSQIDYAGIISMITTCGRQMGMTVSDPVVKHFNLQMRELKNMLFKCLDEQVKFLFIIVPTRGRDYYHRVKQLAEREVGILTQCIKEFTALKRMNTQTVRNILLKVNSKLMGINQALDNRCMPACLREGRVMVVGADVTHPSPDQTSVPSIAAVTASIDPKCFMYNIALSIQTPKKEMIVEFEDMMVEHLTIYRQRNGALPTKIFVFRDGVSEGQFAQVMNSELLAVHQAYQRLAGTAAKPEVLFLLVQKRHHTRLFFENSPRNVEPGTVVDRDIVHATELDFYLVSHQAIKGTARPTRYHAVCNDGGIKHDEVEQLTYYLCHLYSRCMRSVSYPTPTYYAHLACLRARSLTFDEKFDNARLEKEPKRLRVLDKMLQYSRMFFV